MAIGDEEEVQPEMDRLGPELETVVQMLAVEEIVMIRERE